MPRVLIVDDEPKIVRLVADYLTAAGFGVTTASSGDEALMRVRTDAPDLVVLDLGLPGLDGLDVTRTLRRNGELPIIMLTARDDELDKVLGLELGADDYITKPFSIREFRSRVRALLRRAAIPLAAQAEEETVERLLTRRRGHDLVSVHPKWICEQLLYCLLVVHEQDSRSLRGHCPP